MPNWYFGKVFFKYMNKKFRLTSCNICGSQAPSNFMVRAQKKVVATSRNTVGGKEIIGSFLGSKTSQNALKTSLLTSRKRTHMTYRTAGYAPFYIVLSKSI